VIKITDKAFRYTSSFNTDLKRKFRQLELTRRAAAATSTDHEAAGVSSVMSLIAARTVPNA
jgi:hypothetical protein